jgi:hypothetical protein
MVESKSDDALDQDAAKLGEKSEDEEDAMSE